MGHTAQQCGWKRFAKCGGEYDNGKCNKDAKIKCYNCSGEDNAAYARRIVQIQAKEVQRYKIVNKVPYAEALKSAGLNKMQPNGLREHFENQSDGRTQKNEISLRDVRRHQNG